MNRDNGSGRKFDIHCVPQAVAALVLGISARTLRDLEAPRREDGGYDLVELVRWRLAQLGSSGELDLEAERARLAHEQANKQALDNAARRGEYGVLKIWREELETVFVEFRAALLAMPCKEAPQLDGDVNQREKHLARVVRELLTRFASYHHPAQPARRKANGNGSARHERSG